MGSLCYFLVIGNGNLVKSNGHLTTGMLNIFSFSGKIVGDSTAFRDGRSIWPEGYTAVRKFTSVTGEVFFFFL